MGGFVFVQVASGASELCRGDDLTIVLSCCNRVQGALPQHAQELPDDVLMKKKCSSRDIEIVASPSPPPPELYLPCVIDTVLLSSCSYLPDLQRNGCMPAPLWAL